MNSKYNKTSCRTNPITMLKFDRLIPDIIFYRTFALFLLTNNVGKSEPYKCALWPKF